MYARSMNQCWAIKVMQGVICCVHHDGEYHFYVNSENEQDLENTFDKLVLGEKIDFGNERSLKIFPALEILGNLFSIPKELHGSMSCVTSVKVVSVQHPLYIYIISCT